MKKKGIKITNSNNMELKCKGHHLVIICINGLNDRKFSESEHSKNFACSPILTTRFKRERENDEILLRKQRLQQEPISA